MASKPTRTNKLARVPATSQSLNRERNGQKKSAAFDRNTPARAESVRLDTAQFDAIVKAVTNRVQKAVGHTDGGHSPLKVMVIEGLEKGKKTVPFSPFEKTAEIQNINRFVYEAGDTNVTAWWSINDATKPIVVFAERGGKTVCISASYPKRNLGEVTSSAVAVNQHAQVQVDGMSVTSQAVLGRADVLVGHGSTMQLAGLLFGDADETLIETEYSAEPLMRDVLAIYDAELAQGGVVMQVPSLVLAENRFTCLINKERTPFVGRSFGWYENLPYAISGVAGAYNLRARTQPFGIPPWFNGVLKLACGVKTSVEATDTPVEATLYLHVLRHDGGAVVNDGETGSYAALYTDGTSMVNIGRAHSWVSNTTTGYTRLNINANVDLRDVKLADGTSIGSCTAISAHVVASNINNSGADEVDLEWTAMGLDDNAMMTGHARFDGMEDGTHASVSLHTDVCYRPDLSGPFESTSFSPSWMALEDQKQVLSEFFHKSLTRGMRWVEPARAFSFGKLLKGAVKAGLGVGGSLLSSAGPKGRVAGGIMSSIGDAM